MEDIAAIRELLDATNPSRQYVPHRQGDDKLQILSIINFKGGSAKTTTTAHLAQYLALKGYRVLAIDLDPPANLSTYLVINLSSTWGQTKPSMAL